MGRSSSVDRQLRRRYEQALHLYRSGSREDALTLSREIRDQVRELGASSRQREVLGLVIELEGCIFKDRGEAQLALDAFQRAESILIGVAEARQLRGRIQFSLAMVCDELFLKDESDEYIRQAAINGEGAEYAEHLRTWFIRRQAERIGDLQSQIAYLEKEVRAAKVALDELPVRRGIFKRLHNGDARSDAIHRRVMGLQSDLAALHIEHGDDAEAADGLMLLASIGLTMLTELDDAAVFLESTYPLSFLLDRPQINLITVLEEVVPEAFMLARRDGAAELRAHASFLAALLASQQGDERRAREHVLASVAEGELSIIENRSSLVRQLLKNRLDERRDCALTLSIRAGDAQTAAELLEGQRLQTIPLADVLEARTRSDGSLGEVLAATGSSLGDLANVSVGGNSQLAEARSQATRVLAHQAPIPIEDVIAAVGGPQAWWWGSWGVLRRHHWALRAPSGDWHCGTHTMTDDEIVALQTFAGGYLDQANSQPWTSYTAEWVLASRLGSLLIPSVLRQALLSSESPISLVLAGNLTTLLPVSALGVADDSTRLIEYADVRVQPPAILVRSLERSSSFYAEQWPVRVACLNPTADLEHSSHTDLNAEIVLTCPKNQRRTTELASEENFRSAFSATDGGQPGIFFYSGHVSSCDDGGLNTALELHGGDVITAGDWFGITGKSELKAPTRAIISACSSSGAAGTGSGEWLGLGAALLVAGARQVVATAWSIPDSRFTSQFERALLERMTHCDDVAAALCDLQREALRDWRAGVRTASPISWAAFQCLGVIW